ncbi:MAG: hypothetical protein D8M58_18335 [Calditrichaeota bacterium]|nr:MAG: hypothetical protein DWQ03_11565 [Calditrichota bacterium]MBL1207369.1 hypothetical protein [Calditrichota bacterium]NOG47201.1 hypothetical protein [Calditrichota bacterium]
MRSANIKIKSAKLFSILFTFALIFSSCSTDSSIINSETSQQSKVVFQETIDGVSCTEGQQKSGAFYKICVPDIWNRELVLYAHGYVSATEPIALPDLSIDDTTSMEKIITDLGYAFATTSYSKNGLAVKEGMADLADLIDIFKNNFGRARRVYLIGASEGGLITNLSMEKNFFLYDGALSICGPTGDFAEQINYFGDFRVTFDFFFPGVIPGSAVDIPQEVMDNFETVYIPAILSAIEENPAGAAMVLKINRAAVNNSDPDYSIANTIVSLLWYNVFATNNAAEVLGGQPFDNSERVYSGGAFMRLFNAGVQRFSADENALAEIENTYQTSGNIFKPLVMIHTFKDPIVPKWQQDLYIEKVAEAGNSDFLTTRAINRYGHCNFTSVELTSAFITLIHKVTGESPIIKDDLIRLRIVRRTN